MYKTLQQKLAELPIEEQEEIKKTDETTHRGRRSPVRQTPNATPESYPKPKTKIYCVGWIAWF